MDTGDKFERPELGDSKDRENSSCYQVTIQMIYMIS